MKKILIVEDDKDMQEIYRDMFKGEEKSYDIEMIGEANGALKKIKEKPFDLIILDIIMEPMSGDSFFVHAKTDPKTKNIPILIVSILKQDTLSALAKVNKFYFLQKPITKEKLLRTIGEIVG